MSRTGLGSASRSRPPGDSVEVRFWRLLTRARTLSQNLLYLSGALVIPRPTPHLSNLARHSRARARAHSPSKLLSTGRIHGCGAPCHCPNCPKRGCPVGQTMSHAPPLYGWGWDINSMCSTEPLHQRVLADVVPSISTDLFLEQSGEQISPIG